jgi:hypothetical protein
MQVIRRQQADPACCSKQRPGKCVELHIKKRLISHFRGNNVENKLKIRKKTLLIVENARNLFNFRKICTIFVEIYEFLISAKL